MKLRISFLASVAVVMVLALVGVFNGVSTTRALMPLPVQPFLADASGGMADTTLGLINVPNYTITNIPRGSRTTLPWIYSGPGFGLAVDKDMPDNMLLGDVFSYVDAACDSGPGIETDILAQTPCSVSNPVPLEWRKTTTVVEGDVGSKWLKLIVPPYSWLARHTAVITNICLYGTTPKDVPNVLNTVYTNVPFAPNGSAYTATTKLGGDPSKPPTATCLDSPQSSVSMTTLYRAPVPEGDLDGVCDTESQACADAGIYGMWTSNSVSIPNGGTSPLNVDKRKVNNGPEPGDFEELWEVESTNAGIMAEWVGHGPVFAEDIIGMPVGTSVEQDEVLSITCTTPANNQWGLVVLKNILSPIPPTEDTYLDDNAFTFVVLVKCGTPVVLPEVDKEVIWIKTVGPSHIAPTTPGVPVPVLIDELKANHGTTDVPGNEWLVAEVGDVVAPVGPDLILAWAPGVTVTALDKTTQTPTVTGGGTPTITFQVNEWPGQADVNATLNIACPATTPPGLYPVVVKAIDVPVGVFESKPSDNAQRKVITVRCGGAAPSGGEDANGLYARWTVFQSVGTSALQIAGENRKSYKSPPSIVSDIGYVERIVDLQCYWMDIDGCFKDELNTVPCNDDGNGYIDENESWDDWDLKQLGGGIDAVDTDRDCLTDPVYAQPGHPVDSDDSLNGVLCDTNPGVTGWVVYSEAPNIVHNDTAADQDCDGLVDGIEKAWGSNPKLADSDGDGAKDFVEIFQQTNPLNPDTDGDGYKDAPVPTYLNSNILYDNCPTVKNGAGEDNQANNDGQRRPNGAIAQDWASNPNQDKMGDACDTDDDNDALPDTNEVTAGTDAFKLDSDGDTVNDGAEVIYGTNPLIGGTNIPLWTDIVQQLFYRGCHHNLPTNAEAGGLWADEYDWPAAGGDDDVEMDIDGDGILCGAGGDKDSDNGILGNKLAAPVGYPDNVEAFRYGLGIANYDTDGDTCPDWVEITDFDGNRQSNIADVFTVASRAFPSKPANTLELKMIDLDANLTVNINDVFAAAVNSALVRGTGPASCGVAGEG